MRKSIQEKRVPLRQVAYSAFMSALGQGLVKPGQMVSQRELCELLDVPLAPVREALKRLEAENMVRLIPQRGIEIIHIDERIIEEVYQIRRLLEREGLRAYAQKIDAKQVRDLIGRTQSAIAMELSDAPADMGEANSLRELDHEMHRLFISALSNRFAEEAHRRALAQIQLIRYINRARRLSGSSALQEHVSILNALLSGDVDEATQRLEAHLDASLRRAKGIG